MGKHEVPPYKICFGGICQCHRLPEGPKHKLPDDDIVAIVKHKTLSSIVGMCHTRTLI
jgi:hypothetical protein